MQNSPHDASKESVISLAPIDNFSKFDRRQARRSGRFRKKEARASQNYFEQERRVCAKTQVRERISLGSDWHVHPGDPADANILSPGLLRLPMPMDADFLSALEDDCAPIVRRGSEAESSFGREISWVQPNFPDEHWGVANVNTQPGAAAHTAQVCWYRRSFVAPSTNEGRQIRLHMGIGFDRSLVWLNGRCLGRAGAGPKGFRSDLTPHLVPGTENTLVLRVPSRTDPIDSGSRVWNERTIHLVKTHSLHLGLEGTSVKGRLRSGDKADLSICAVVHNKDWAAQYAMVSFALIDPSGRTLAQVEGAFHIFGKDRHLCEQTLSITDAAWLLENPCNYHIRTAILVDDRVQDEEIEPFDLRVALSTRTCGEIDFGI